MLPGKTDWPFQLPSAENGRLKRADEVRRVVGPRPTESARWSPAPLSSSWPETCSVDAVAGLALSATLTSTLALAVRGNSNREMPVRVVVASSVVMAGVPRATPYRPGCGLLRGVGEALGGGHRIAVDGPDGGEDRYVAVAGTTGAAQVGQAEAGDARVRPGVAPPEPAAFGEVSGLHWSMPKGTSAPGNSPMAPGFTGPLPVPSRGRTSALGSATRSGVDVAPAPPPAAPAGVDVATEALSVDSIRPRTRAVASCLRLIGAHTPRARR